MEHRLFTPWTVGISVGAHLAFIILLALSPLARPARSLSLGRTVTIRVAPGIPGRKAAPKPASPAAPKAEGSSKKLPPPVPSKPKAEAKPGGAAVPAPGVEAAAAPSENGRNETAAAGTTVQGLDAAYFPFDYYVTQFLNRLSANWYKPVVPPGTGCVVRFTITRSGRITDAEVEKPSAYAAFDRAALRAVLSANPLPPLPFEFNEDQLGVHLKFE